MRYLYSFLLYLILPFLFLRLLWKSRKLKSYRQRFSERLGFYPVKLDKCLWVHAASVGETLAAIPLIKTLMARYPHLPMLVTTTTPTGAARVKAGLGESVTHVYLPYDFPDAMQRFLRAMNPQIGVIMETEIWPNLLHACAKKNIPVCLVNARLSEKSARGYHRIAPLAREMLNHLAVIAAHGEQDAKRFIELGADKNKVIVTGNLKFDLELPKDLLEKSNLLRLQLGQDRFIWVAASTHEGEEDIVLAAHQKLLTAVPNALLILVPRHPDRFDTVDLLSSKLFKTIRRSKNARCTPEVQVYLGDTMGELLLFYSASDVDFVGGSLIPRGGHNMLEVAAIGKPILTGPHVFNFTEIADLFFKAQAMIKVSDAEELAQQLITLAQDAGARKQLGDRAKQVMDANGGALQRQCELICVVLELFH